MYKFDSYLTCVPLPSVFPRGSLETLKDDESDSHTCCSSSLCFDVTIILSDTEKYKEIYYTF
jgi:hypothetical protein